MVLKRSYVAQHPQRISKRLGILSVAEERLNNSVGALGTSRNLLSYNGSRRSAGCKSLTLSWELFGSKYQPDVIRTLLILEETGTIQHCCSLK
jgi:hypothetical protein